MDKQGAHACSVLLLLLLLSEALGAPATFDSCISGQAITSLRKGDAAYESQRIRYYQLASLSFPKYILLPSSEAQIQGAVRCLRQYQVPFVVRSGGHSYAGFSSIGTCGAVLDLSSLRQVAVNTTTKRVTIGAGVRLGLLYYTLWQSSSLVFPGGTCPSVAAAGLLLSGGHGLLTRRLGMGADSVLAARVVLPNGTLVAATATRNSDLFRAIRGGSGSYGIVSSWTLQARAAPATYTQLELAFPWSKASIVQVLSLLYAEQPWTWPTSVTFARLYMGAKSDASKPPLRLVLHFWGSTPQLQAFMQSRAFFSSNATQATTLLLSSGTYIAAQLRAAAQTTKGIASLADMRASVITRAPTKTILHLSAYTRGQLPAQAYQALADWALADCTNTAITFLGGAAAVQPAGGTGYDGHRKDDTVYSLGTTCTDVKVAAARASQIRASFGPFTTGTQYMGYMAEVPAGQDPFASAFGTDLAQQLKGIRDKYDPDQVMRALTKNVCP